MGHCREEMVMKVIDLNKDLVVGFLLSFIQCTWISFIPKKETLFFLLKATKMALFI